MTTIDVKIEYPSITIKKDPRVTYTWSAWGNDELITVSKTLKDLVNKLCENECLPQDFDYKDLLPKKANVTIQYD